MCDTLHGHPLTPPAAQPGAGPQPRARPPSPTREVSRPAPVCSKQMRNIVHLLRLGLRRWIGVMESAGSQSPPRGEAPRPARQQALEWSGRPRAPAPACGTVHADTVRRSRTRTSLRVARHPSDRTLEENDDIDAPTGSVDGGGGGRPKHACCAAAPATPPHTSGAGASRRGGERAGAESVNAGLFGLGCCGIEVNRKGTSSTS